MHLGSTGYTIGFLQYDRLELAALSNQEKSNRRRTSMTIKCRIGTELGTNFRRSSGDDGGGGRGRIPRAEGDFLSPVILSNEFIRATART